ncbi:hypothetical protein [Calothrix sp. NIES-2098]|uniref:hypothetical protein n=1 Tax=Calothrix sp. NIES-2098 TaxID=1954171 RepID=UPI000B5E180B|nr:hypothetical protein NIES2098_72830 [Calothrix sp. NIES-2098]
MKRLSLLLITTLFISATPGISLALPPARNVYSQDAQGHNSNGIDLKVWSGYGLTINFISTGETIKQVWLGDPSHFALSSNGNLCQRGASNDENCGTGGATVLFLRQIKPIDFPSLTSSVDGSTVMTVITNSSLGQKQYQFKLIPAKGKPQYTSLIIKPDSDRPKPLSVEKPDNRNLNTSTNTANRNSTPINRFSNNNSPVLNASSLRNDANSIAVGLAVAVGNGTIKPKSVEWRKAQDTIRLLRKGKPRTEAIRLSGIPQNLFNELMQWGQRR